MLEQNLTAVWILLVLRQHSFHWIIQYYHADYRSCRTSAQPNQSFFLCWVHLLCFRDITQLPECCTVHFLEECAIAFNKVYFKVLCHTLPNCTLNQYKSFHFHFFTFHSLHLIWEALKANSFLAFMPAWRCKYNNAGAKMTKESEWETLWMEKGWERSRKMSKEDERRAPRRKTIS